MNSTLLTLEGLSPLPGCTCSTCSVSRVATVSSTTLNSGYSPVNCRSRVCASTSEGGLSRGGAGAGRVGARGRSACRWAGGGGRRKIAAEGGWESELPSCGSSASGSSTHSVDSGQLQTFMLRQ